jgi:hypothetical protein
VAHEAGVLPPGRRPGDDLYALGVVLYRLRESVEVEAVLLQTPLPPHLAVALALKNNGRVPWSP